MSGETVAGAVIAFCAGVLGGIFTAIPHIVWLFKHRKGGKLK